MNLKLVIFSSLYRSNCYLSRILVDNYSRNVIFTPIQIFHVNLFTHCNQRVLFSSTTCANSEIEESIKDKLSISKTLKAVFQHSEHNKKLQQRRKVEYGIGKRHLANMMGEDPENFGQEDVDRAISYLLPSGLYDAKARPMMKPPDEVFRAQKPLAFDSFGRPFHPLFYTGRPSYYSLLQEISFKAEHLDNLLDAMEEKPEEDYNSFNNSNWIKKEKFETIILEKVTDDLVKPPDHQAGRVGKTTCTWLCQAIIHPSQSRLLLGEFECFIRSMERLIHHPLANTERDFLMKFRQESVIHEASNKQYEILYTKDEVPYVTVKSQRKTAIGTITVYGRGTGQFTVNGQDILYFENIQDRHQVMFPLQLTNVMHTVDVEATVKNGGPTGQAGAIKLGIAAGLVPFLPQIMIDKLRLAGLLTLDWRKKERQKPGKRGARKSYKWKKR